MAKSKHSKIFLKKCKDVLGIEFIHDRLGAQGQHPVYVAGCDPDKGITCKPLFPEDPIWQTHGISDSEGNKSSLCHWFNGSKTSKRAAHYILDKLLAITDSNTVITTKETTMPSNRAFSPLSYFGCPLG